MRINYKHLLALLLSFLLPLSFSMNAWAVTIAELQEQIRQNQNNLNNVSGKISELEDAQDLLQEEIEDTNAELINLYTEISVLEDEIAEKEDEITVKVGEIEQAQSDFEAAQAEEDRQYEAMKKRIKYMYEVGDASYLELFLSSTSFSDMLNKVDYVENLYEYDRKMLLEFQAIKQAVAELEARLEEEEAQLQEQRASLESDKQVLAEQQSYLNGILAQKKAESKNYDEEIAAAKKKAAAYKAQIAADNKKIAQIQEEERRKLAAKNGTKSGGASNPAAASTVAAAQAIVAQSNGSALGKQLASYGCRFIGNPYVAGGTSLTNGADCSGFIFRIYSDFGYRVSRTSYQLRSQGTGVSYSEAQPGDIICYEGHVGMYIGGGMIVHASSAKTGIKVSNAQYRPILAVRRVV